MKVLIIDNYDSFTYNLVQILRETPGIETLVRRNDQFSDQEIESADAVLLSPGPGLPQNAGQLMALLQKYAG
ncbi:MAG TPA: aminodeoxychorismate/anthranilate synthase component II, partial [Bacteroidetes bacterium]|nr:aminodeoxychorismate/anthranilate synthase component II [Bacteroidota bacterium]